MVHRQGAGIVAQATLPRQLSLIVEDDGPGLAADKRLEVLRRGARLDESAPGSGLGLSIVDELVRAYGGSVTLSASAMGGLMLEIALPRADMTSSALCIPPFRDERAHGWTPHRILRPGLFPPPPPAPPYYGRGPPPGTG